MTVSMKNIFKLFSIKYSDGILFVGWGIIALSIFWANIAFGAINVTPAYDTTSAYLTGATASVDFDGTGYIEVVNPDGDTCSMDQPGWNGFGTQNVGVGTALDTTYFPGAFSTCVPAFSTPGFWTPDGTYTFNLYTDPYNVGLYDSGTFCQGATCSPPTPTPTTTPTSTTAEILEQLHYDFLWFLWFIVFACSFYWFERYYKT